MKKLTVVQVLPALDAGGVERGTLEIARALVAAGHRSIVVSHGGRMVTQLQKEGSEHIEMPVHRKSLVSLWQVSPFRQLLRELQPDILHVRSRVPAWIAWLAWRGLPADHRPHFVTTVHGLYSVSFYSAIMTKGERVIAVSETVRDYIRQHYRHCPEERIRLIYRGVSLHEFPHGHHPDDPWLQAWRKDFPVLEGKLVLALPGRVTRLKGHEAFLDLIERLLAKGFPVHGLIVGGAETAKLPYLLELKEKARRPGLAGHISFTGHRGDMREVFTQCALVFSLSNKPETFGRTTLEALSIGTPVVGWRHGGVGEILRACYPAGLVDTDDVGGLVETCERLLREPVPVAPVSRFTLEEMCGQTLELYRELAGG